MQILNTFNLPKLIFTTGIDGSGKTFLSKMLISELKKKGIPATYMWSRFNNITSKPLLAFCRLKGLNYYKQHDEIIIGYHDFEKSRIISWLFVFFQLIDVWLVTLFIIWPKIRKGKVLICDRGVYDTLIDVMIDTKITKLYNSSVGKAFLMFLPESHKVFFILRESKRIHISRPDVRIDKNFDLRFRLYQACSKKFNWTVVMNNSTPEETLKTLITKLSFQ